MVEKIRLDDQLSKEQKYKTIVPQIKSLIDGENDLIANMANISSALYFGMGFFWVGFYIVKENELVLGPFHGPVACSRIQYGKGVCGTAWQKKSTIIVPNVNEFPGHIACSNESKSEIVVCSIDDSGVRFVLDIDSENLNSFDETDKIYLELLLSYMN
jgi:GAF domain-containing protein